MIVEFVDGDPMTDGDTHASAVSEALSAPIDQRRHDCHFVMPKNVVCVFPSTGRSAQICPSYSCFKSTVWRHAPSRFVVQHHLSDVFAWVVV